MIGTEWYFLKEASKEGSFLLSLLLPNSKLYTESFKIYIYFKRNPTGFFLGSGKMSDILSLFESAFKMFMGRVRVVGDIYSTIGNLRSYHPADDLGQGIKLIRLRCQFIILFLILLSLSCPTYCVPCHH